MKPFHFGIAVAVALSSVLSLIFGYRFIKESQNQPIVATNPAETSAVGKEASAFFRLNLPDTNGQVQALQQWRGKVLVANYWATWCPPCRDEMPGFARLQEKFAAKDVQFVGISIDSAAKVAEFQKESPVNYPLLIGETSATQSSVALGNSRQALPFTAVIDRKGMVRAVKLGRFAEADLERLLNELI